MVCFHLIGLVYTLGCPPLSVTVANEGLKRSPTKNVIVLVVTGILGGGTTQFIFPLIMTKQNL